MAVFRIEKTRDYTVMSNYHLRDRSLSLKAKGMLSLMLSLPEDWDYTMKGACPYLQGRHRQHQRRNPGAGGARLPPEKKAGPDRTGCESGKAIGH